VAMAVLTEVATVVLTEVATAVLTAVPAAGPVATAGPMAALANSR